VWPRRARKFDFAHPVLAVTQTEMMMTTRETTAAIHPQTFRILRMYLSMLASFRRILPRVGRETDLR
jgi:hypothetical protein